MAGSLLEVRKRIAGVQNTSKITKAMQLVAASKMRQFQKKAINTRKYTLDLFAILEKTTAEDSYNQSVYTQPREQGKTLFVIYTSDKGLCGPLNNKLINGLFKSSKWLNLKPEQKLLITIGKKSYNYAQNNKIPILKSFIGLPEKISNLEMIKIINSITEYWKYGCKYQPDQENSETEIPEVSSEDQIKEIIFMAPHYKNSFTFYPVMKKFLPLNMETIHSNIHAAQQEKEHLKDHSQEPEVINLLYSPSSEKVISKLHEFIIQSMFIQALFELKASEYSSRMIAMQNATDSANRIINELRLTYNKARQQAITQEIAELIGASMAIEEA